MKDCLAASPEAVGARLETCSASVAQWLDRVFDELKQPMEWLAEEERALIRQYHAHMISPGRSMFYRYHLGSRLAFCLAEMEAVGRPLRLLDAACGVGTPAILYAWHGHSVMGVDVQKLDLAICRRRIEHYRGRLGALDVTVRQVSATAIDRADLGVFDCVHVSEALGHIHPAEQFLEQARQVLKPGGLLLISESNGANIFPRLKNLRVTGHWNWVVRSTTDPESGEQVVHAYKRLFSPPGLARFVRGFGFEPLRVYGSGFIPPQLTRHRGLFRGLLRLEKSLRRVPFYQLLGLSYTLVACKRSEGSV